VCVEDWSLQGWARLRVEPSGAADAQQGPRMGGYPFMPAPLRSMHGASRVHTCLCRQMEAPRQCWIGKSSTHEYHMRHVMAQHGGAGQGRAQCLHIEAWHVKYMA